MANKTKNRPGYKTQIGTTSANGQTTYTDVQLQDADNSPFISADELMRCLEAALQSPNPDETNALVNIKASTNDIKSLWSSN